MVQLRDQSVLETNDVHVTKKTLNPSLLQWYLVSQMSVEDGMSAPPINIQELGIIYRYSHMTVSSCCQLTNEISMSYTTPFSQMTWLGTVYLQNLSGITV
jgi:hypothetical protein